MNPPQVSVIPTRPLGRTGHAATLIGLGGEGVLRTHGRDAEATAVIEAAIEAGINYCDTAPAYASSQDYYGRVFRADPSKRDRVFLASKTHDRTKVGALRLLDDSLRRLGTDRLDLWQLHDLRTREDLEAIFEPGGALEAALLAKKEGRVRFVGITGHHDPEILAEALRRHPFDTILMALNASERVGPLSFLNGLLPLALSQGIGVIGMKVMGAGHLVAPHGPLSPAEALSFVWSQGVSLCIVGCRTPDEVRSNVAAARVFSPLDVAASGALEERARLSVTARFYRKDSY